MPSFFEAYLSKYSILETMKQALCRGMIPLLVHAKKWKMLGNLACISDVQHIILSFLVEIVRYIVQYSSAQIFILQLFDNNFTGILIRTAYQKQKRNSSR